MPWIWSFRDLLSRAFVEITEHRLLQDGKGYPGLLGLIAVHAPNLLLPGIVKLVKSQVSSMLSLVVCGLELMVFVVASTASTGAEETLSVVDTVVQPRPARYFAQHVVQAVVDVRRRRASSDAGFKRCGLWGVDGRRYSYIERMLIHRVSGVDESSSSFE